MQKHFDGYLNFLMYSYLHLGFSKCKKGFWTTSPVWPQCCCISDLEWLMVNASNQDLLQATLKEQILNLILALCVLSCLSFDNGRFTQETTPHHDDDNMIIIETMKNRFMTVSSSSWSSSPTSSSSSSSWSSSSYGKQVCLSENHPQADPPTQSWVTGV